MAKVFLYANAANFRGCIFAITVCFAISIAPAWASGGEINEEEILWAVAQKKNTLKDYDSFLLHFPKGKLADLAKTARKKILAEQLAQAEKAAWLAVQDSEIIPIIETFLAQYPNGSFSAVAKAKIAYIRKIETDFKPGQAFKGCANCPEMMIVPSGSLTLGENQNTHLVTFAAPFAISKKEVTQKEWVAIMGSNPSKFEECKGDCPLNNVSWYDVQEFIRRLNIKTGKVYRLPTEAEWEYACRAGSKQIFCGSNDAKDVAWFGVYSSPDENSTRGSHPVATKKANAWGLYDMSGNVAEWTADGYHENLSAAPIDGSAWQTNGRGNVLRGGSWEKNRDQVRSFSRDYDSPENRDITYGFRLARKFP